MQNITIGKSGIEVPFLGMGTWAIGGGSWWGDNDDALSVNAIEAAVEQGIRWIDTAPIYGLYHSEQVVGEALRHIDRDKVVLSTKCGLEWRHETPVLHKVVDGTAVYRDLSAQSIIEDVEESLKRLGTDHLDVLYTHWQSPDLGLYPLEETVEAMMKLKERFIEVRAENILRSFHTSLLRRDTAARENVKQNLGYFLSLRGMSQKELAMKLGVSQSAVTNWIKGKNSPDIEMVALICQHLHISVAELFGMTGDETYSDRERVLVAQYRNKPDMRRAVDILLEIEGRAAP